MELFENAWLFVRNGFSGLRNRLKPSSCNRLKLNPSGLNARAGFQLPWLGIGWWEQMAGLVSPCAVLPGKRHFGVVNTGGFINQMRLGAEILFAAIIFKPDLDR